MKLRKTTLVLMVLVLGMVGVVYLVERTNPPTKEAQQGAGQPIFAFKLDQVKSLTITSSTLETPLTLERIEPLPEGSQDQWQITKPESKIANTGYVVFLLDKLTTGKSDRSLTASTSQLTEYGLDQPQAKVEITLKDQTTHQLILGTTDFSNNFLYAQVDPAPSASDNIAVSLVPVDFLQAIERPLSEWEKPKEETPPASSTEPQTEPTPTPAATPSPTTEETPNPETP